jgi:hypothetical protein
MHDGFELTKAVCYRNIAGWVALHELLVMASPSIQIQIFFEHKRSEGFECHALLKLASIADVKIIDLIETQAYGLLMGDSVEEGRKSSRICKRSMPELFWISFEESV